jgi:LuxR family maltose regulon positive regulatory protein
MTASTAVLHRDVPRVPSDVIARPRLIAALENDSPLTVIRGAGGSGKTVAMAEWARSTDATVIWVTVEPDATDSADLAREVLRALVRHGRGDFSDDALARPWATVAEHLRSAKRPLVLILDDAAPLSRESVFDVCRIIAGAPTTRLLVATNRRSPFDGEGLDLIIDRLIVTADDLMFDVGEIAQALHIDRAKASAVHAATDGFPALIHAATRRSPGGDAESLVEGAASAVEDHMRLRIERSGFDATSLDALVRMSVTDAVDLELARILTDDSAAAQVLDEAEAFGFGYWSGADKQLFSFSPVARILLRRELRRSHAAQLPKLRRSAVAGALRRGAPAEALRLAVEQDDLALASQVIMRGWNHLLENDGRTVVRLLGPLPLSRLKDEPLVAMLLAICFIASKLRRIRGLQLLRVAIAAANSRRNRLPAMERIFIWAAESAALRLIGMPERAAQVASRAAALFEETPESDWEAYAVEVPLLCTQLGISLYYGGQEAKAIGLFDYAAALAAAHELRHAFHGIALLSGIHALNGDMPEARHYVELIRQGTWDQELLDGYRGTFYRVAEALLAVEAHDLESASAHVSAFGPHRSTSEHWIVMAQVEAWVALHRGRAAAGLEQLESLARLRGREAGSSSARAALSRSRALFHLAVGDLSAARHTLHKDAHPNRPGAGIERARLALAEGRASDASRMLTQTRSEPQTARQRAEAAALQCAALRRTAGAGAARANAEALGNQLEDRELTTPMAILPPEDFTFIHNALDGRDLSLPAASALPSMSERPRLSSREKVVLRSLTTGSSLTDIAADLNVSQNTLKTQLRSIYRKLDAVNRSDAVEKAARLGLLSD